MKPEAVNCLRWKPPWCEHPGVAVRAGRVGTAGDFLGRPVPSRGSTRFVLIFIPLIWTAFGVSMVVVGVQHRNQVQPLVGGTTTTGVVVGNHWLDKRAYEPVVRFRDGTGVIHEFRGVSGGATRVGTRVQVSYDPQDPARARDLSQPSKVWGQLWLGIGWLVFEVLFAGGIMLLTWITRRRRRRGSQPVIR